MERIQSFSIDHMTLLPGVYISREDKFSPSEVFGALKEKAEPHDNFDAKQLYPITTYDIRMTRPNFEPVMSTAEIHAIEHIAATYLRNLENLKSRMIYWGPMGCRTGFYLIMAGRFPLEEIISLMRDTYRFVAEFEGDIPGASPKECGNYSDMDLAAAKKRSAQYLKVLEAL